MSVDPNRALLALRGAIKDRLDDLPPPNKDGPAAGLAQGEKCRPQTPSQYMREDMRDIVNSRRSPERGYKDGRSPPRGFGGRRGGKGGGGGGYRGRSRSRPRERSRRRSRSRRR